MLTRIIANTPAWVWGLLVALLWLGLSQTRTRQVGLRRVLILPLLMTGLSLSGIWSSFSYSAELCVAWTASAAIVLSLLLARPAPAAVRYDHSTGLLHLPGSWLPLALILAIFAIKYAVGASLAIQPDLAKDAEFSVAIAAVYGALAGAFIARASRLWQLSRTQSSAPKQSA